MIREVAFQTRARTVDHLGREQIADCPTAISELWKNAYDAYARNVELNVYDGDTPIATISDDGHGMGSEEFINRWLVVGTESKAGSDSTPEKDRFGLRRRSRQGQKGIGRLSSANLGPLLLLVSKRADSKFVAALVDWRLFENPFINLADIFVPVTEFEDKDRLFTELPALTKSLEENVTGGREPDRKKRLQAAWQAFDETHQNEIESESSSRSEPPSEAILGTLSRAQFAARHFEQWPVWSGESDHGTVLLIAGINYDLQVLVGDKVKSTTDQEAASRFFETLSSFVDPFLDPDSASQTVEDPQFSYAARRWIGDTQELIVGSEKEINRAAVERMEHLIEGRIDSKGVFTGRVRAFGEEISSRCVIEPPNDLSIPTRADSVVGPFRIFIASMEFLRGSSTHTKEDYDYFLDLATRYAGFMVFRNGLRVLPFGRTDNDFFDIEMRRSFKAGREFWNHRQMFGRVAISRERNPNLRDKAGREGLIDNRAAKTLKALVANILMQSARQYFGSDSALRKEVLPKIQKDNEKEKAREARNKLRRKHRREFRSKLKRLSTELPDFAYEVEEFGNHLKVTNDAELDAAKEVLDSLTERFDEFKLPGKPPDLGTLEDQFADYSQTRTSTRNAIAALSERIDQITEEINPSDPAELLENQLARNAAQIHRRIQGWKKTITTLQREEAERVRDLIDERNKAFHAEATPLVERLRAGTIEYAEASKQMDLLKWSLDAENSDLFPPYIGALESLKESIDLEHLATFGMEELSELRTELERLNSLAQLGIAVEIVGHELQAYDDIIGGALSKLPNDVRESRAGKDIEFGYEGLTDQLRFLSPLRLAGQKIQRWITGDEIVQYVEDFFGPLLTKNKIKLSATTAFRKMRVYEQQSRLYPVFINLVNNSLYWLAVSDRKDRQIILDVVNSEVVVSDNGPGVDPEDQDSLFSLFFTKKIRGGRGVGLYLSRANLAAGGHQIRYENSKKDMPLEGANFVIAFRGAEFDGS